jgi:hypothetical protein
MSKSENELWQSSLTTLRLQFFAASNLHDDLHLTVVTATKSARDKLAGPPVEMWRGTQEIVYRLDVDAGARLHRFYLWGAQAGLKRFHNLAKSAERALGTVPGAIRSRVCPEFQPHHSWLELLEQMAWNGRGGSNLYTEHATWSGSRRVELDSDNQVILGTKRKRQMELFDGTPDYYFSALQPDVFSASVYALDALLGDGVQSVTVLPGKSAARVKPGGGKKARRRVVQSQLTSKQKAAWLAYGPLKSYAAVAEGLGISRQAATKLIKAAVARLEPLSGRSVPTRRSLPRDRRGQEIVSDDD